MNFAKRWPVLACASVTSALASPLLANADRDQPVVIQTQSVLRGADEPGRFAAWNLFDGRPDTAYCAPPGTVAAVNVDLYPAVVDRKTLVGLRAVEIRTADRGVSKVFVRVSCNHSVEAQATIAIEGGVGRVAWVTPPDVEMATSIGIRVEDPQPAHGGKEPRCVGEVTLLGDRGPLRLPGLDAAVGQLRVRDASLLAARHDAAAFARLYLTTHRFARLNPFKEVSTWESASYDFAADGSYREERHELTPEGLHLVGQYRIAPDGTITLDGARRGQKLAPCPRRPGYLCLDNGALFPSEAW